MENNTIDLNSFRDKQVLDLLQISCMLSRSQKSALLSYAVGMLHSSDPRLFPDGETELVRDFWDFYDAHHALLNHRRDMVAINLPEFLWLYQKETGSGLSRRDLIRMLPKSQVHPFRFVRSIHSFRTGGTVKCWCFFHTPDQINLFNYRDYNNERNENAD